VDRPIIETAFGMRLDQIYMATEGLLAVTCRAGTLHLAEDSIYFEFEPVGADLVSPLISCFRRQTQIMARYRMNDLLRLSDQPCSCGSPLRAVDEIVGRMDDCFHLPGPAGGILVTPDILRNAVLRADPTITDFRIRQTASDHVELVLAPDATNSAAAAEALAVALKACGADARVSLLQAALPVDFSRKLRRVECCLPRIATS
jgi:putative adenylate-forming enzyme